MRYLSKLEDAKHWAYNEAMRALQPHDPLEYERIAAEYLRRIKFRADQ